MKIKMFADGANEQDILRLNSDPRVEGFTTNPTLFRKAGVTDYLDFCSFVAKSVWPKPVSLEVIAQEVSEMDRQARVLDKVGQNVFVKIPVIDTQGLHTGKLISSLSEDGIKLNVTAIFSKSQVEKTLESLTPGVPSVVSVFAGRIADAGIDPVPLMRLFADLVHEVQGAELLWASPREILNVVQAEETKSDIITMTPDLWAKLPSLGKDLEQFSLETVLMFDTDARESGYVF